MNPRGPNLRLSLVLPSLHVFGGAERVLSRLANHWSRAGWLVEMVTFDDGSEPPAFPLDPAIRRRALNVGGDTHSVAQAIVSNWRIWTSLRLALRENRPDAVISFLSRTNARTLLASLGTGIPIVVSDRMDPVSFDEPNRSGGWFAACSIPWPRGSSYRRIHKP
ncbi:MAG: glycosyltransferase [Candidatus Wallbacteria bacterium]|nr:glycosyltransferase [Candidatus Wallbacteria bacterium]